jgi:isochorismate synthase EntC
MTMGHVEAALHQALQRGLTFAAFRLDGAVHLWVADAPPHPQTPEDLAAERDVFVIAPFHTPDGRLHVLRPQLRLVLTPDTDLSVLGTLPKGASHTGSAPSAWDATGHAATIAAAQAGMARGDLRKVVLSRTFTVPFPAAAAPALFVEALGMHPDAFVCLLNSPVHGTWIGASPERLLVAGPDRITVDSLAGTMPLTSAPADPNAWGAKERDEQEVVTRMIVGTLEALGVAQVECGPCTVRRTSTVAHLHTTITAGLGTVPLHRAATALHPTPAVCGLPTDAARAFILAHEPHSRDLYTGFWGPWNVDGRTHLFVNLRCARLLQDEACLYVGGGITPGSDAAAEWAETEHKAHTWLRPMEAARGR